MCHFTHSVIVQAQCQWPASQAQATLSGKQFAIQQFIDILIMHVWTPHEHCLQQLQATVALQTIRPPIPNTHPKSPIPSVTMSSLHRPLPPFRQTTFEGQNSRHHAMRMTDGVSTHRWLRTHTPISIPRLRCTHLSRLTDICRLKVPLQPTTQDVRRSIAIPLQTRSSTTCFSMSTSRIAHLIV